MPADTGRNDETCHDEADRWDARCGKAYHYYIKGDADGDITRPIC